MGFIDSPLATRRQLRIGFEVSSSYQISRALVYLLLVARSSVLLSFSLATIRARYRSLRIVARVGPKYARALSLSQIQTRRSRRDSPGFSRLALYAENGLKKILLRRERSGSRHAMI
jgi:hypothetical protein